MSFISHHIVYRLVQFLFFHLWSCSAFAVIIRVTKSFQGRMEHEVLPIKLLFSQRRTGWVVVAAAVRVVACLFELLSYKHFRYNPDHTLDMHTRNLYVRPKIHFAGTIRYKQAGDPQKFLCGCSNSHPGASDGTLYNLFLLRSNWKIVRFCDNYDTLWQKLIESLHRLQKLSVLQRCQSFQNSPATWLVSGIIVHFSRIPNPMTLVEG